MKKLRSVCVATSLLLIISVLWCCVYGANFQMVCQDMDQSGGRANSSHFTLCVSAIGQSATIGESGSGHFVILSGYVYSTQILYGDADGNAIVNISDVVYLISYIFGGGLPPDPWLSGDADCNQIVNISDAVYLISYIFGGGPPPCAGC